MSLKMKADVLAELIKRLRSGRYTQGSGALRRTSRGVDRYCCLGVLCEMAVEAGVVGYTPYEFPGTTHRYGIESAYLPTEVIEWAGIVSDIEKDWPDSLSYEARGCWGEGPNQTLACMNDSGMPFPEIAGWMEANVERV